jgi:DNA polymerase
MVYGRIKPAQHIVSLRAPDDFADWREKARALLSADVAPDEIVWQLAETEMQDLFGGASEMVLPAAGDGQLRLSKDFLALLRHALMHSIPTRFALAYRLLWRIRAAPHLQHDPADRDVIALRGLAKAVRRDIHKMHAFVRFRKVGQANGREQFAAWFEPDHHIVHAVAGFFRDRFTGMDWRIVTPRASIGWDGDTVQHGPGGQRSDVPGEDAVEDEWRSYYANIFNPARLKINAMKREMPVRYWRNLPEAPLIAELVQSSGRRVDAMIEETRVDADLYATAEMTEQPQRTSFDNLEALYTALVREDRAPSDGFSEDIVLGEGKRDATLMIIGEQPGDQEDRIGRPFVGPAGQLLDHCLEEADLSRDAAFLTNAVKRFKFSPRGKKRLHQTPSTADITHYRWWLAEEIRLVDPKIIIALGASAVLALTGRKQALNPLRGAALPWQDRQLIVTVHPSFLLRLPDAQARDIERERFVRDLRRAALVNLSPTPLAPPR